MRSSLRLGVILALMLVTIVCAGSRIQAWNPATHIYIAQRVYPAYEDSPFLWYGAIAPDMAMYVYPDASKWSSSFWDTHWVALDLRPWASNGWERIFARGWITHNEMYGADHYAHGYPPLYLAGYITFRANLLAAFAHISTDLAHMALEAAVDIHLQTLHSELAWQLADAMTGPPAAMHDLLNRVFVRWPLRRTDLATLTATESYFRCVIQGCTIGTSAIPGYASALAASSDANYGKMIEYGAFVAKTIDPSITLKQVEQLLGLAMAMTADYDAALDVTIKAVKLSVPR
jgi:hypothetical protein